MSEPRIVIRRRRHQEEEYHGGSWKIAYADFMTAMMAFFLIMWVLTLVPREDLPGIAEFFRQPLISKIKGENDPSNSRSVIPGGSPSVIPNASGSEIQTPSAQGMNDRQAYELRNLEDLKSRLETLIATNPRLTEFRPQMVLDMTPEGLRIQIVDSQNKPMFATGSARINREMQVILQELAPTLNAVENGLSVAGHTDAVQYATGDRSYSNWELSSDRANAARIALVEGGIAENKVRRVMGLGSTMNSDPDPYADANRRISIVVLNQHTDEMMRKTYSGFHSAPSHQGSWVPTTRGSEPALGQTAPIPSLQDIEAQLRRAATNPQVAPTTITVE